MIYSYLLPTPFKPEILIYNPTVPAQDQPFLALWRICKAIRNELPSVSSLLETAAIIPTIDMDHKDFRGEWEASLAYLTPFLGPACVFRIQAEAFEPQTGRFRPYIPLEGEVANDAWHEFRGQWMHSNTARQALRAWLLRPDNQNADDAPKKRLFIYKEELWNVDAPYFFVQNDANHIKNVDEVVLFNAIRRELETVRMADVKAKLQDLITFKKAFADVGEGLVNLRQDDKTTFDANVWINGEWYAISKDCREADWPRDAYERKSDEIWYEGMDEAGEDSEYSEGEVPIDWNFQL